MPRFRGKRVPLFNRSIKCCPMAGTQRHPSKPQTTTVPMKAPRGWAASLPLDHLFVSQKPPPIWTGHGDPNCGQHPKYMGQTAHEHVVKEIAYSKPNYGEPDAYGQDGERISISNHPGK